MENKINFLVDTNVWLERLLDQEKSKDVKKFLEIVPLDRLFISDFTPHSIGIIMAKMKRFNDYYKFVNDLFVNGNITQLSLNPIETEEVIKNIEKLKLDFDDSYQYSISLKFDLGIVSFDRDFKKAGLRIIEPSEVANVIKKDKPTQTSN
jgi:predicted nucleic acid-binding protein